MLGVMLIHTMRKIHGALFMETERVEKMNPGYLSLIWIVISLILLVSGWKDVVLHNIPRRQIAVFFIAWFLLVFVQFEVKGMKVYGIVPLIAVIGIYGLVSRISAERRLQTITAVILLGTIDFGMRQTEGIAAPALPDSAFILALAVTLLVRKPALQISALSLSLLLSEGMVLVAAGGRMPASLGDAVFQDHWWMTVCTARIWTLLAEGAAAVVKHGYHSLLERTRQWRK